MLLALLLSGTLNYTTPSLPQQIQRVYECSAYTRASDECGKDDGITASGTLAIPDYTIAADDLSFGTKVLIRNKEYEVQDRFGGNYTGRIDIYKDSLNLAKEYGRKMEAVTFPGQYSLPPLQYYG